MPLYSQWQPQTSGINNNLRAVYFLTKTTGFAVGDAFSPNPAPVLKTTDGGLNWVIKSSDTPNPLRDIAFNTNVKGFACGFYGTLVKTNDIGETWDKVSFEQDLEVNFRAIDFPSKEVGYVAGSGGVFLKTIDVGISWDSLNTGYPQDLLEIEFLNNDTGYATGSIGFSNGIILRTYDGGASWQTVFTSSQAIPALIITKNSNIYAGGGTSPSGGHEFIILSEDGGDTWQEVYSGPSGTSIRRGAFISNTQIWFVNDKGSVIKTKDSGETWVVNNLIQPGLNDIFFTEEDTGYAVGGLGSILKFTPCPEPIDLLGKIKGNKIVCNGTTTTYSIAPIPGVNSYEWTVPPGATIDLVEDDTVITVTFGLTSGDITVVAGGVCDTSVAVAAITVIPPLQAINTIVGPGGFCAGDTATYYIAPIENALTYTWSVPPDATILQQDDTLIVVALGSTSGTISVTAEDNCDNISTSIPITLKFGLGPIGTINGDTTACLLGLGTYTINNVLNTDSYNWTLPAGASIIYSQGDTLVVIQFDSTGGTIGVTANGFCDTASAYMEVTLLGELIPIDTIIGDTAVCEANVKSYSIQHIEGALSYQWTVPEEATILSGQGDTLIVVSFGSFSGEIYVSASVADCNTYEGSLSVTVTSLLAEPDDIIGVTDLCSGDTSLYIISEVPGADSYHWEVPPGATLLSGQGQTLISILFGATSGNVVFSAISACDTVTASLFVLVEPPVPPISAIAGDTTVCMGDTVVYSISPAPGVSYSWLVPLDAAIITYDGDTSITVVFGSNSGEIEIVGGSACAFQDTSLSVTVISNFTPNQPIIGQTTVCSGDTVTYAVNGTAGFTYDWTIPSDAILYDEADTSITVIFGNSSGIINVVTSGTCITQDTFVNVTVIPTLTTLPIISGDTIICSGDTAVYTATGIQDYDFEWTIPSDATLIASGDNFITVVFGITSGNIELSIFNSCFSEEALLPVVVVDYPPVPVITFVDNNLISSAAEGNQWYLDESPIAGATEQVYTPLVNGTYSVSVTYPPGCVTVSDTFTVISVGYENIPAIANVVISPNPFESFTTLHISNNYQLLNCTLEILNVDGNPVFTMQGLRGNSVQIKRNDLSAGMYFYRLTDGQNSLIASGKLVVQ